MKYRPDNWKSIAGKDYTLSNEFIKAKRNIISLLTERLLTVGFSVLSNRWEEDIIAGKIVWKSTIYPEDYMEAGGSTLKNTLAVFRNTCPILLDCWVEFESVQYKLITAYTLEKGIITLYWNSDIIGHIAERSMLLGMLIRN
jgi:hypothetical protein